MNHFKRSTVTALLSAGIMIVSFGFASTASALQWLHLDYTYAYTPNQIKARLLPGEDLYGWRFANPLEVESLFTQVHPGWLIGLGSFNDDITQEFADLFRYTNGGFNLLTSCRPLTDSTPCTNLARRYISLE